MLLMQLVFNFIVPPMCHAHQCLLIACPQHLCTDVVSPKVVYSNGIIRNFRPTFICSDERYVQITFPT